MSALGPKVPVSFKKYQKVLRKKPDTFQYLLLDACGAVPRELQSILDHLRGVKLVMITRGKRKCKETDYPDWGCIVKDYEGGDKHEQVRCPIAGKDRGDPRPLPGATQPTAVKRIGEIPRTLLEQAAEAEVRKLIPKCRVTVFGILPKPSQYVGSRQSLCASERAAREHSRDGSSCCSDGAWNQDRRRDRTPAAGRGRGGDRAPPRAAPKPGRTDSAMSRFISTRTRCTAA